MRFVLSAILSLLPPSGLRVCSVAMAWRAIYCEPRREFLALKELEAVSSRAFCLHEVVKENVRAGWGKTREVETMKPYFPGYVFAETDEIKAAEDCRGVIRVLKHGTGEPWTVPPREIRKLLDVTDSSGAISWTDTTKISHDFHGQIGDIFEFLKGGFHGRCGKIASLEELDSRGKVSVIIQAFGSEHEIKVSHRTIGSIISRPSGLGSSRVGKCEKPVRRWGQVAA